MIEEHVKPKGTLVIEHRNEHGELLDIHTKNMVVSAGLALITARMIGTAQSSITHMAVGSGTTAAKVADVALVTQLARVAITSGVQVTTTVTNDAVQYVASFPAGIGTGAVTEAGLFNHATAGTMLARTVFAVLNKGPLDTITITWRLTFS